MVTTLPSSLLSGQPAAIVENATGRGGVVLICEHAGQQLPNYLPSLGIAAETMSTHIAWDIGAAELARSLSRKLDAPLVLQRYSRLVFDCNRRFDAHGAFVEESDRVRIPGNLSLSMTEREKRFELVYEPFAQAITEVIDGCIRDGISPAIVTIHSFTPLYKGQRRDLELGVLHDSDTALADRVLSRTALWNGHSARRNEPYAPSDGVTHTLITHGINRGLENVMLEIRNDLISHEEGQSEWSQRLADAIGGALSEKHR